MEEFILGSMYITTDVIFYSYVYRSKGSDREFRIMSGILPPESIIIYLETKIFRLEEIHPYKSIADDLSYLTFRICSHIQEEIMIADTHSNRNLIELFETLLQPTSRRT